MPSQQRVNWARFRVTCVIGVSWLILLTLFYLLTGGTFLSQKVPVYLYMPDGEGLEAEAPVRVDGVDVGEVKMVRLSGSPDRNRAVRVVMEIDRARISRIPANSEAEISSDSLIGDKFVDVTSHPADKPIEPGGEIKLKQTTDLMKAIDILDLERQLRQVDAVLQDLEAGRGDFGQFLRTRTVYDNLVKRIAEIETDIRAAVAATTNVGHVLYKDELYRGLLDSVATVDLTLAQLESGQGEAGRFLRDPAQFEQWRARIADLRKSVKDLQAQPLITSDTLYPQWNRSLESMIQSVDELNANPMFNTSEMYDRVLGAALEIQNSVRDFREHPQKYLRIAF